MPVIHFHETHQQIKTNGEYNQHTRGQNNQQVTGVERYPLPTVHIRLSNMTRKNINISSH